ncbi:MAG: hypothetical protein LQ346_005999 [Caloplaca aetnensis]|nr:MAG: hypothetical protein LQ346_005999 [Caloplaca aetnensis]
MADSIRGDGLYHAERALANLAENPERLDRARKRFSVSPPSYTSQPSGVTTLSNSPGAPSIPDGVEISQEARDSLDRNASIPRTQFSAQQVEEEQRIFSRESEGALHLPPGTIYTRYAFDVVKKRWQEQGIWSDEWNSEPGYFRVGRKWKHEEPGPSSDVQAESEAAQLLIGSSMVPKTGEIQHLTREEQGKVEHDREASRPIHQFYWQLSKERDRIHGEVTVGQAAASADLDINTKAYENVKKIWRERSIWDIEWGLLPGMTWKHERPLERTICTDSVTAPAQANAQADPLFLNHDIPEAERLSDGLSASPVESLIFVNGQAEEAASVDGPRNAETVFDHQVRTESNDNHPVSDGDVTQPPQPEDLDMANQISENPRGRRWIPHPLDPVERQRPKPRRGRPKKTPNGRPTQAHIKKSLGPSNPSRVSKPLDKEVRARGRPKKSAKAAASEGQQSMPATDETTTPARRRSKRTSQAGELRDVDLVALSEPAKVTGRVSQKKLNGTGSRAKKASATTLEKKRKEMPPVLRETKGRG